VVEKVNHPNFSLLFDTSHAYLCSSVGARQAGRKEILDGGIWEFIRLCKGKIGHLHLADSDGTLHDEETSTHAPLGSALLDFNSIIPALIDAGYDEEWCVLDLCYWPGALEAAIENKGFFDNLLAKHWR
jgi:sugar phosphate isomerase/epimerase